MDLGFAQPLYAFSPYLRIWLPLHFAQWCPPLFALPAPRDSESRTLRVVTYNVWFDALLQSQRSLALCQLLEESQADVICLQEVTPPLQAALERDAGLRANWVITRVSDQTAHTRSFYGTVILLRSDLQLPTTAQARFVPFLPSTRGLLLAQIGTVSVGTVHLDGDQLERTRQIRILSGLFPTSGPAILCGDTNMRTADELEPLISARFADAALDQPRGDEPTYGFGAVRVKGAPPRKNVFPRRLDAVLVRGAETKRYSILGDTQIPKSALVGTGAELDDDLEVYPSDHFGLCVDVAWQEDEWIVV